MHIPTYHFARFFRAGLTFKKYCRVGNDPNLSEIDPKRLITALSKGYPSHLMGPYTDSRIVNNPLYQYSYSEELLRLLKVERWSIAAIAATTGVTFYFAGSLWGLLPMIWLLYRAQRFYSFYQGVSNSVSRISLLNVRQLIFRQIPFGLRKRTERFWKEDLAATSFYRFMRYRRTPPKSQYLKG